MAVIHDSDVLTSDEVAQILGVSPPVVRQMAREGRIPARRLGVKVWRFHRDSIDQWIRGSDVAVADTTGSEEPPCDLPKEGRQQGAIGLGNRTRQKQPWPSLRAGSVAERAARYFAEEGER